MIRGSLRLLNVRVTQPQPNQRGDPDSSQSRFEISVMTPAVPSYGAGWSHFGSKLLSPRRNFNCCSRQQKPQKETRITRILSKKYVVPKWQTWFVADLADPSRRQYD